MAGEMAQLARAPANKPKDSSSIPRIHTVERTDRQADRHMIRGPKGKGGPMDSVL